MRTSVPPTGVDRKLHQRILACTLCAPMLPLGPRPVVQFSHASRILIIGQAPGSKVHQTGIPWDDPSGERLREWIGLSCDAFYDPVLTALMPMGFCYPGKGKSGDLPPRPECAPQWHRQILDLMPDIRLTLLVGSYAQRSYLSAGAAKAMTDNVRMFNDHEGRLFALPHPSWRSTIWMKSNPWFESDVLPALQRRIRLALAR